MSKDQDIRPTSFDDYVGQRFTIDVLRRAVVAARHGDRACGHVLLAGMPGCIAADMRISYDVRDRKGKLKTCKTRSLEHLFKRFHGLVVGNSDVQRLADAKFSVNSMDEDGMIRKHEILDVVDSGVKKCVRVRTVCGFELVCTPDHPLATDEGFVAVDKLGVGAAILTHQGQRWTQAAGERRQAYRPEVLVKHHPNAKTKVVRDKARGYVNEYKRLRRSSAVYEACMNNLTLDEYVQRLNDGMLDGLKFLSAGSEIHHIDENPSNDDPDNLVALSHAEHARGHIFDSNGRNHLSAHVAVDDEIESIEDVGERHVYDIKMVGVPHNFVIEGFVVHNCGKTSLANIISAEMSTKLHAAVATAIEHKGELTGLLTTLGRHDVLFLDEIHGLSSPLQELLYTAMEDGHVDLSAGKRTVRLPLQPFTLVGATTRAHLLTGPLRDRFAYTFQLGHYSVDELATIAQKTMSRLGLHAGGGAIGAEFLAAEIGRRSRGVPRIANRLVRNLRDFAESAGEPTITQEVAEATFDALGLDSLGLDDKDREYLGVLCERLGSPVGVLTIAAQLGIERGVVEGIIEPALLEARLIMRTQKGRIALPAAVSHLHAHAERARVRQLAVDPEPEATS